MERTGKLPFSWSEKCVSSEADQHVFRYLTFLLRDGLGKFLGNERTFLLRKVEAVLLGKLLTGLARNILASLLGNLPADLPVNGHVPAIAAGHRAAGRLQAELVAHGLRDLPLHLPRHVLATQPGNVVANLLGHGGTTLRGHLATALGRNILWRK